MVNMYILTTIRRYLTLCNGFIRRHSAKGVKRGTDWSLKMQPWVEQWQGALDDRVEEDRPYDSREYAEYLRWYQPQTRTRLVYVVDPPATYVAAPTDTYPAHFARDAHLAVRYMSFQRFPNGNVVLIIEHFMSLCPG